MADNQTASINFTDDVVYISYQDSDGLRASRGYVWPNPYEVDPTSFAGKGATVPQLFAHEVRWLQGWVSRRLKWLDQNLGSQCR